MLQATVTTNLEAFFSNYRSAPSMPLKNRAVEAFRTRWD